MTHSFADRPTLKCPTCGRSFSPDVWLIIDAAERPDLLDRVRDETIHRVVCPDGHGSTVQAPLLIFRPEVRPPLTFSPFESKTVEQDMEETAPLLKRLRQSFSGGLFGGLRRRAGGGWREEWLQEIDRIPRAQLPLWLGKDTPQGATTAFDPANSRRSRWALVQMAIVLAAEGIHVTTQEEAFAALVGRPELSARVAAVLRGEAAADAGEAAPTQTHQPPPRTSAAAEAAKATPTKADRPPPRKSAAAEAGKTAPTKTDPLSLLTTLQTFTKAKTWVTSYRLVIAHPELLTPAADALLADQVMIAQEEGRNDAAQFFAEHLALLRRARAVGAERAFVEKMETTAERLAVAVRDEQDHEAVDPVAWQEIQAIDAALRARGASFNTVEERQAALRAHPDLAARLAAVVVRDKQNLEAVPPAARQEIRAIYDALQAQGASLTTVEEMRAALRARPDLEARLAAVGHIDSQGKLVVSPSYRAAVDPAYAAKSTDRPRQSPRPTRPGPSGGSATESKVETKQPAAVDKGGPDVPRSEAPRPEVPRRYRKDVNQAHEASQRFEATGDPVALQQATDAWGRVLGDSGFAAAPEPFQLAVLNDAGNHFMQRYQVGGQLPDLDRALALFETALKHSSNNPVMRAGIFSGLGNALSALYERTGKSEHLTAAIHAYNFATQHMPADSPYRAMAFNNLGSGLARRYAQAGQVEDLEAAIDAFDKALQQVSAGSPDRAMFLNNFGNGLREHYAALGEVKDLDAAILALTAAVEDTPRGSPNLPAMLDNLGAALLDRYRRTGQGDDLDKVIAVHHDAIALASPGSPSLAGFFNRLGAGLYTRYKRTGRIEDLNEAIAAWENALQRAPADAPERAVYLNNLGSGRQTRYDWTGRIEDLNDAIRANAEALQRTPSDSPDLAARHNNLANGLRSRYQRTDNPADLDQAIVNYEAAVAHSLTGTPERARYLNNLGLGLHVRYARTGNTADLDAALGHCRAAAGTAAAGEVALQAAQAWARLALLRSSWAGARQATAQGRATLQRLDEANALSDERLSWRREAQGLAAAEAYALARQNDPPAAALALEAGQAGQLNAALGRGRDRALLERLRATDPSLFAAYEAAAAEARAAQRLGSPRQTRASDESKIQPSVDEIRRRAAAAQTALDKVIARVRARSGYKDLFAPVAFDDVAAAVGDTPLVYLATTTAGSVALLLHRRHNEVVVEALWAGLTSSDLDRLLIRREQAAGNVGPVAGGLLPAQLAGAGLGAELDAALPVLGEKLMAPLAARLRKLNPLGVTLIPGGLLNLLPLHAATYPVNGAPRAFLDEFAVAYAPSAQAAAESRARAQGGKRAGALVVGNPLPLPQGVASLRFAGEEAEEVAALLGQQASFAGGVKALYEGEATLPAVKEALPGRRVLHFAGHGVFDTDQPLDSGLLLGGGQRLTLRDVRDGAALAGARLVVLSACQTGLTDYRDLPDEVIGLPAGFLAAGAAGVVGSLWPVDDRSTALLMTDFHRRVLAGDSPAEALRAAQLWLRGVTWGELDTYYSHYLPRMSAPSAEAAQMEAALRHPAAAAYASPYHWAAFTLTGA